MAGKNLSWRKFEYAAINAKSFQYYHEGEWKTGYYGPVQRVFFGASADNRIITVIPDASREYVRRLQAKPPY